MRRVCPAVSQRCHACAVITVRLAYVIDPTTVQRFDGGRRVTPMRCSTEIDLLHMPGSDVSEAVAPVEEGLW